MLDCKGTLQYNHNGKLTLLLARVDSLNISSFQKTHPTVPVSYTTGFQ